MEINTLRSCFGENGFLQADHNSYEATMESVSLNPNVAVAVTDKLSAAFGVEAMYLNFNQKKKIDFSGHQIAAYDGDTDLEADGMGYGFNMALHYKPCQYAKVGLAYRSPITMKVTGDADFTVPSIVGPLPGTLFDDTSASGVVTLPDSFAFGVAVYPMDKLSIELGAIYTLWSKYDELKINFGDPVLPTATPDQSVSKKNWNDVWRFNVGVEYAALDWLDLRLGYVYDNTPVPDDTIDYLLPDSDRQIFSGGLGFHQDNWAVDVNYSYLLFADRDIDDRFDEDHVYEGKVENADCHIAGVSFTYKF